MHVFTAGSTLTPAYLAIREKGFTVTGEAGAVDLMVAKKGGDTYVAEGPLELLGLIAMVEMRGENWSATDDEIDDFLTEFGWDRS